MVIFGATFPLFNAKDKSLPVIFVHMTPQSIATWNKLLAILTIVSRRYVLAFDVFIQMSPIDGWVVTVCTYPRSIRFQYFGLDQLVNILFRCKDRTLLNHLVSCIEIIWSVGDFSKHEIWEHFLRDRIFDNTGSSSLRTHALTRRAHKDATWLQSGGRSQCRTRSRPLWSFLIESKPQNLLQYFI